MVLKLDPRYPLVWRDPHSLQVGVAKPIAVLADLSTAAELMIAALVAGVSRSGLVMIGTSSGAAVDEVGELVAALEPAFTRPRSPEVAPTVLITGTGATASRIADALAWSGIRVRIAHDAAAAEREDCSFAIIVAQFVVAPAFHSTWLRRDIPHLAVVVSDTEVSIGPVVEPGRGPCLYCLQLHRSDADPAWPAIATQLHGRRSAGDTPLVAGEAASTASRIVLAHLARSDAADPAAEAPEAVSITLSIDTGEVTTQRWLPHPDCGCRGLGTSAAAPRENGSPGAGPRAVVTLHPTTATPSSDLA